MQESRAKSFKDLQRFRKGERPHELEWVNKVMEDHQKHRKEKTQAMKYWPSKQGYFIQAQIFAS